MLYDRIACAPYNTRQVQKSSVSLKNQHQQSKLPPKLQPKPRTSTTSESPTSLQSPSPYHTDRATSAGDVGSSDSEDVVYGGDEDEVVKSPGTRRNMSPKVSPSSPPPAEVAIDLW